jgi:restriction system protein
LPGTQGEKIQYLKNLAPRDFECIVERLYHALGYETQLTPQTRDGGKDVIASITMHGGIERILIECKKYTEEPIRINLLREILGMVSHENVNKGIIVTTTEFTKDSTLFAESNSRLGLVDGDKLVRMLNEFMGPTWPRHIDRYITESLKHNNNH